MFQRLHILWEATAAVAQAGVEEVRANAFIVAHANGHFVYVGAQLFADRRDFIDEADLGGEEGIAGVLDHLCRTQIGDDDPRAQREVELGHLLSGILVLAAETQPGLDS